MFCEAIAISYCDHSTHGLDSDQAKSSFLRLRRIFLSNPLRCRSIRKSKVRPPQAVQNRIVYDQRMSMLRSVDFGRDQTKGEIRVVNLPLLLKAALRASRVLASQTT